MSKRRYGGYKDPEIRRSKLWQDWIVFDNPPFPAYVIERVSDGENMPGWDSKNPSWLEGEWYYVGRADIPEFDQQTGLPIRSVAGDYEIIPSLGLVMMDDAIIRDRSMSLRAALVHCVITGKIVNEPFALMNEAQVAFELNFTKREAKQAITELIIGDHLLVDKLNGYLFPSVNGMPFKNETLVDHDLIAEHYELFPRPNRV